MDREALLEQLKNESVLDYYQRCCGPLYTVLLPSAALVSFLIILVVLLRGKGPTVGPALVLTVPMPVYLGLMGTLDGLLAVGRIIEQSGLDPDLGALSSGFTTSLVTFVVGMMLSVPGFLTAVVGASVRAVRVPE